ncbi:hypothetical protein COB28_03890 [Candidatus Dependentiae bacterium]|nr:MAG: hypothetical protein COB28_03890 [Candidatus Dependentiae bacterium]
MVWKISRTRIANVVVKLQSQKGDLQIFLRACFRIALASTFLYIIYSFISVATDVSLLSCTFHRWQILDLRHSLSDTCEQHVEKGLTLWKLPAFVHSLKESNPYIHSYFMTVRGVFGYSLFLRGYPLICKMNNDLILDSNGRLYSIKRVKYDYSDSLENVYIDDEVLKSCDLKKFINPLRHLVSKGWQISIVTPDDIQLFDDAYKKHVVTCNTDSYEMCEKYRVFFSEMEIKSRLRLKKKQQLLFDMRFQSQIVVTAIKQRGTAL